MEIANTKGSAWSPLPMEIANTKGSTWSPLPLEIAKTVTIILRCGRMIENSILTESFNKQASQWE